MYRKGTVKKKQTKYPVHIRNYKKQRNYAVSLNKEVKVKHFWKYDSNDNKPF